MDPNATLKGIRDAIADGDDDKAAGLFQDLDQWLSGGGYLPRDWKRATKPINPIN